MTGSIKRLAGQTAIYGLSSIVGRFLNYLLVPLYTSLFTNPADYGIVSELYAWIAFLMVFLTFGMETAYFKFLNDREDKDHVFNNSLLSLVILNGGFLLLILLFHQPIAEKLLYKDNAEYIILLGIVVTIDAVSALPLAKLRAENRAKRFAFVQLTSIGINIGLNLILLLLFFDTTNPEQGIRYILIANIIASLIKPILLYKSFLSLKLKADFELLKLMIKYSFPLVLAGFAFIINETIDRILLKHLSYHSGLNGSSPSEALRYAESQVGIYSASYKLAMLVTVFLQAYRYAAEPFFFAQAKDKNRNETYVKVMNYFVGVVFLCFLVVSLNLDLFKYFIPNENYWAGLKVVPVLLLANVCLGVYVNQSIWYKLSGQTRFGAYIAIGGAILTLTFNFLFIPIYGYIACAWITFGVYFVQMLASYFLGQKHYPIPYNIKRFFLYTALAIGLYLIARFADLDFGWVQFVLHNLLILIFVLFVWWMEKQKKEESPSI